MKTVYIISRELGRVFEINERNVSNAFKDGHGIGWLLKGMFICEGMSETEAHAKAQIAAFNATLSFEMP
jgi:hypothetical protein